MEATLTKDYINGAVAAETENAKRQWGEVYHSEHEAWSVLLEEYEEAQDEFVRIGSARQALWGHVRQNTNSEDDYSRVRDRLNYLKDRAIALAIESVQMAAVAQKYIDTVEAHR